MASKDIFVLVMRSRHILTNCERCAQYVFLLIYLFIYLLTYLILMILTLKCIEFDFGWGFVQYPAGEL